MEVDSQGVPRPIRGHMLKILQHHILTVEAKFDKLTGFLHVEETFRPLLDKLPPCVRPLYDLDQFMIHFGGV